MRVPGLLLALLLALGPGPAAEAAPERLASAVAREAPLPIQRGAESRLRLHEPPSPRGIAVMYHGFSAGTWQFDELAEACYAAGYDVFVPRLPGHGFRDAKGAEDPSQLPTGPAWASYEAFAEDTYQAAASLGTPVHLMGLSVGGSVALRAAERHPEASRLVLFAPFLRHRIAPVAGLFDLFHGLDRASGSQASRLLEAVPYAWDEATQRATAEGRRPGHSRFTAGHVYAAMELGRAALADASRLTVPTQLYVTAIDDCADEGSIRAVADRAPAAVKGWYRYPAEARVPHPMLSPREDQGAGHTPALYRRVLAFLASGSPQGAQ